VVSVASQAVEVSCNAALATVGHRISGAHAKHRKHQDPRCREPISIRSRYVAAILRGSLGVAAREASVCCARCHLRGIREACLEPWRMAMESEALVHSIDFVWLGNSGHLSRGGAMLARR
jgi:hypothetical protein